MVAGDRIGLCRRPDELTVGIGEKARNLPEVEREVRLADRRLIRRPRIRAQMRRTAPHRRAAAVARPRLRAVTDREQLKSRAKECMRLVEAASRRRLRALEENTGGSILAGEHVRAAVLAGIRRERITAAAHVLQ